MRAPEYSERADELFSTSAIEDPQPFLTRVRTRGPLTRVADTGVHLVLSWELIEDVLAREDDFSANLTGVLIRGEDGRPTVFPLPQATATRVIATADEPRHAVHRQTAQPRMTANRTAAFEEPVRAWVEASLQEWLTDGGGDFIPLAEGIPARVVAHLLGLPSDDVRMHRDWAMMGGDMLAGDVDVDRMIRLGNETARMGAYLEEHFARALESPTPDPDAPLLRVLAAATEAGRIDVAEAVGIASVMFGAGGESTAGLIGSVVRRLAMEPDSAARLRAEPQQISRYVEETVRLDPPFKFHYRAVRRGCRLGGYDLEEGDRLMLYWAAANRDPAEVENPDRLRLDRRFPRHHLGFGRGAHFCIGAALARLEARIVCEELLRRTRSIALVAGDPPVWARSIFVRRLERLPLAIERA